MHSFFFNVLYSSIMIFYHDFHCFASKEHSLCCLYWVNLVGFEVQLWQAKISVPFS